MNNLWQEAMSQKIMLPQYHAREHVNGYLWLKDLKAGVKDTRVAFDNDFFGVKTKTSSRLRQHYLATYFSESLEESMAFFEKMVQGEVMPVSLNEIVDDWKSAFYMGRKESA